MTEANDLVDVAVAVDERPAFDALRLAGILLLVFEDLPLLLLRAVEGFVLLFELRVCIPRRGHLNPAGAYAVPVNVVEEGVTLDLGGSTSTSAQPLAGVAVEQVHDEVFGFLGHAHGELEDAALDVVEQFVL